MRTYTWEEYYEKFYDWAESMQVRNLSYLTSLGDADEVAEIIIELQVNVSGANRLLRRAVEEHLKFKSDDLIEFLNICDMKIAEKAVLNSADRLNETDMEDLYGFASEDVITKVCSIRKFRLPEDMDSFDVYEPPQRKVRGGFLATLFAGIAGASEGINDVRNQHNGRCNGDCAHCPPHYGYRYGRWYYGHDHTHGCEFGGNKGSGGL